MFVFRKIWRVLFSCNTHFEIRPFASLPTNFMSLLRENCSYSEFLLVRIFPVFGVNAEIYYYLFYLKTHFRYNKSSCKAASACDKRGYLV